MSDSVCHQNCIPSLRRLDTDLQKNIVLIIVIKTIRKKRTGIWFELKNAGYIKVFKHYRLG